MKPVKPDLRNSTPLSGHLEAVICLLFLEIVYFGRRGDRNKCDFVLFLFNDRLELAFACTKPNGMKAYLFLFPHTLLRNNIMRQLSSKQK
jgi:hypothetical protein